MEQALIVERLKDLEERARSLRLELEGQLEPASALRAIAWGAKVSSQFKSSVLWIEDQLGLNADALMACMAFETGGTFSPSVKNAAGSSGLGLIQFMSFTHKNMLKQFPNLAKIAPTHADLAKLDAVQQLSFVYYYFKPFGDLSDWSLEDVYMAILYPAAIGKPSDWTMPWKYGELAYKQNAGLDKNKDRKITKAEAAAGVRRQYELGMQFKG